jgi:hypothetical protein
VAKRRGKFTAALDLDTAARCIPPADFSGECRMPLSDAIKTLIDNAWTDGAPVLLATAGPDGPNVGPKGSLFVYDDNHLAYWERTRGALLDNLRREPRVCVLYANFRAQREGAIESGFLRFFGTVELYESGPVREAIFARLSKREREHAGADAGIGVLIRITRAADIRGKPIL